MVGVRRRHNGKAPCNKSGGDLDADESLNVSIRSHGMLGQLPTNEDANPVQGAGESYFEHTLLVHYLRSLGPLDYITHPLH